MGINRKDTYEAFGDPKSHDRVSVTKNRIKTAIFF